MFVACHTKSKVKYVFNAQQNNIFNKKAVWKFENAYKRVDNC